MDRIEEIRAAAEEYGRLSVENMRLGEKLGLEIMTALDHYLTPKGGLICGVPPSGDWEPEQGDYCDAAFSFYHRSILNVRDTQFGMSVQIFDHLWVRVVVNLRKEGERIGVFVDDGEAIWIPLNYSEHDIQQICERLFQSVVAIYREDVNVFTHGDARLLTIGFGTSHAK